MYTLRCFGMTCLMVIAVVTFASAQQQARPGDQAPAPAQAAPAPAPAMAAGELTKVDTAAKTISIKTEQGGEMKFTYTDATKVVGADGVAGLATTSGAKVIVKYRSQGQNMVATEVEVQKPAA